MNFRILRLILIKSCANFIEFMNRYIAQENAQQDTELLSDNLYQEQRNKLVNHFFTELDNYFQQGRKRYKLEPLA